MSLTLRSMWYALTAKLAPRMPKMIALVLVRMWPLESEDVWAAAT